MNLKIRDYIDTYKDYAKAGEAVFATALPLIEDNQLMVFDMQGLDGVSTVFLNTSFGHLIDVFGIERVKKSFRFSNVLRSQAERIKKYFQDYQSLEKSKG